MYCLTHAIILMLNMLGNDFTRRHFEIIPFFVFSRKIGFDFRANCLQGKIKKKTKNKRTSICRLLLKAPYSSKIDILLSKKD